MQMRDPTIYGLFLNLGILEGLTECGAGFIPKALRLVLLIKPSALTPLPQTLQAFQQPAVRISTQPPNPNP